MNCERKDVEGIFQGMKIAMLGHKRIPSREGGIEVVVEEVAVRMVKKGHSVTCYNRRGHHVSGKEFDAEKQSDYKGIKLNRVPTIQRRGLAAVSSSFFGSIFCALGKYDIVHYHAEGPCVMLWLPKLFHKKCIVTVHGFDWKRAKWGRLSSRYIKFGEEMAARFADEIIVFSTEMQEYFRSTYQRETRIVANGVNRPVLRNADRIRQKYDLNKNDYILYVGRLVPEKGIHYLIRAYQNVKTDKKLVIAGGTSDTDQYVKELKQLAAGNPNIIFTGFVQGRELEELYSNAYLFCLPSDLEGMPLSLLEAMSYGNCCIVSDIAECKGVVEDKAFSFKRGNIEELRKVLQKLSDHPDMVCAMKKDAADFICSKYNWDESVEKLLAIYIDKDMRQ